jgi:hypothetical protein
LMRARYSAGIGGEPAGRSSYECQATSTSYACLSFSRLEETRKHHGQTKSDQTSIRTVTEHPVLSRG